MKFGIDKCAALSIHCGKIQKLDGIEFKNGNIIKSWSSDENYTVNTLEYLKQIISCTQKLKNWQKGNISKDWGGCVKSKLNGGNAIKSANTRAVRYQGGIIDWTQNKLQELNWKTQKLPNMHHTQIQKLMWIDYIYHQNLEAMGYCKYSR